MNIKLGKENKINNKGESKLQAHKKVQNLNHRKAWHESDQPV
jgi:hypothetical protein